MSPYSIAWLAWIVAFVVIESLALFDKRQGDTLSEHVRLWAGVTGKGPGVKLRRLGLLLGLVWLTVHLLTVDFV